MTRPASYPVHIVLYDDLFLTENMADFDGYKGSYVSSEPKRKRTSRPEAAGLIACSNVNSITLICRPPNGTKCSKELKALPAYTRKYGMTTCDVYELALTNKTMEGWNMHHIRDAK